MACPGILGSEAVCRRKAGMGWKKTEGLSVRCNQHWNRSKGELVQQCCIAKPH